MLVLGGDIGGTKTRLGLFEMWEGHRLQRAERAFPSADHDGLESVVEQFLRELEEDERPSRAGFGLAGPVTGRRMRTTNLPWTVDADELERRFGLDRVVLLNDLEATAWGIGELEEDSLPALAHGAEGAVGNIAVIAPGTGLGEAGMYWNGATHRPWGTEGGHASFAPVDDEQVALLAFLRRKHVHVSWERVVSGPGLVRVFRFVLDDEGVASPVWLEQADDPAATVARRGLDGADPLAERALALFVRLYGAEAGNLALKVMSTGGVYLGGGITPKIRPALERFGFLEAFRAKGRMRPLLEAMPVRLVLDDRAALYGAARRATRD